MCTFKTFLAALLLFSSLATAQKKATSKVTSYAVKYKAPKLQTFLANYKDSAVITTSEAENIIALPIKVSDSKKTAYTISSYQFLYKKKVVTEDEATGKVSGTTSIVSDHFKASPLPLQWINIIREQLKSREELYFFDIIVKDAQGRLSFAPNLKIIVQ